MAAGSRGGSERQDGAAVMPANDALAAQLLQELCNDILDIQIGTLMFWNEAELRDDHFAEYVHHWLLEASQKMGWDHVDSTRVWKG